MEHSTQLPAGVRELDSDACWRLLASQDVGRVASRADGSVDVFPVNYVVHERALYFRTAAGSKLADLESSPEVAFEIDGRFAHHVWSVVVHGLACTLVADADADADADTDTDTDTDSNADAEIAASGITRLKTWYPNDKDNCVRITPTSVTGRDFFKPEG